MAAYECMKKKHVDAEKKRLKRLAGGFSMADGFDGKLEKYMLAVILNLVKGDYVLDVGCADGVMAAGLAPHIKHMVAIDGSSEMIAKAKKRKLLNVTFVCSLFEDYKPERKFDTVILSEILEHVADPVQLLKKTRQWVKENGVIVIITPNATSLHRQIGVLAGILHDTHDLDERDRRVGHRRVYDMGLLQKHIRAAKLKIIKQGGIFLKPLSNAQMDTLDQNVINAFYLIGKRMPPELLTQLYVQCRK